jgi:polar amino acid transport system substrate-binding protein
MLVGASLCAQAATPDAPPGGPAGTLPELRGGWYLWDPYQFNERRRGESTLTGLDVELLRAVAREAGRSVGFTYRAWAQHLAQIESGEADVAAGATRTPEREAFAHFSVPYRRETNVLVLPRGNSQRYPFTDVASMLRSFEASGFRVGVVSGFMFADPLVNDWLRDPAHAAQVVLVENDYENFRNLADGGIDGLLADRLVAATTAWRGGWRERIEEHPLQMSVDIHFMFSKATVDEATVRRFDDAIESLRERGESTRILANFVNPLLLAQTLDRRWFVVLEVIGTVAFALSGVLIAIRERYTFVGALLLSALPAVAGGAVRDLLVGRTPLAVVAYPLYLGLVVATVVAGFLVVHGAVAMRRRGWMRRAPDRLARHWVVRNLYEVSDAVGLAAFTVTGVAVAVATRTEPIWLWGPLLAMLTAAGGGLMRDMVRQAGQIASLKGDFYAEVPLIWGLLFALYFVWATPALDPDHFVTGIAVTVAGAFATRMAAVVFPLRAPLFAPTLRAWRRVRHSRR